MPITIGRQLGYHEIIGLIGRGGMGEVYRARDTKLKREVAIKILPEEFSRDPDRIARFQREAEVLASLNHPNIAAIYDLSEAEGSRFLVLEFVEGETLAERIARGPIPIEEALNIARNICEALEVAHEKGITHRDLKPANIKLTPDGKVKVLDFGLAKAVESTSTPTVQSNSPTMLSLAATNAGVILGTAAYMSPEQAKGRPVDRRTDIFAFGCVLYEMLTGRSAFDGEDMTEILGRVVTADPDWTQLPSKTPPSIHRLLRRALKKDPLQRLDSIRDVRLEIEDSVGAVDDPAQSLPETSRADRPYRVASILLLIVAMALTIPAVMYLRQSPLSEIRLDVTTPPTSDPLSFAISPDGRRMVFSALNEGKSQLWLRRVDSVTVQPLAGTESGSFPFWSPDSSSIGFFADSKLKRVDIMGGPPQVLANASNGTGGTWNRDGTILFAPSAVGPLTKVSAMGGESMAVTRKEAEQVGHRFPQFLPDGRHFIYFVFGGSGQGLYVGSLDGGPPKLLVGLAPGSVATAAGSAALSPSGFLLFLRQTTLLAQAFDFKRLELSGNPFLVAEQVTPGFTAVSNIVAYRTGSAGVARQLTWLDRSGKSVGTIGAPTTEVFRDVELSPDAKRVAVTWFVNGNLDVWLLDADRGVPTRFTFDTTGNQRPVWSPDGSRIVFDSNRKGNINLFWKLSNGAGADELLLGSDQNKAAYDWSSDGRFLLFRSADPRTANDLWVLPLFGERKPFPFLKTTFDEREGQFSPDGKWIAYQSNESGRFEVYVQPFPGPGGKFRISSNGGAQPRWNKNGKEIFYVSLDSKLMAASVKTSPDGQSLETGTPAVLFPVRIAGGPLPGIAKQQYAVSADGQRFLVNLAKDEGTTSAITLIYNWHPKP